MFAGCLVFAMGAEGTVQTLRVTDMARVKDSFEVQL